MLCSFCLTICPYMKYATTLLYQIFYYDSFALNSLIKALKLVGLSTYIQTPGNQLLNLSLQKTLNTLLLTCSLQYFSANEVLLFTLFILEQCIQCYHFYKLL